MEISPLSFGVEGVVDGAGAGAGGGGGGGDAGPISIDGFLIRGVAFKLKLFIDFRK